MAKNQTKETYKNVQNQQTQAASDFTGAQKASDERAAGLGADLGAKRSEISDAYKNLDTGNLDAVYSGSMGLGATGGYDDSRKASIMENVAGLKEFGKTGGLDEESISRFRGKGGYDEFASTGGYSEGDKTNIRSRALAPISSMMKTTQDELDRRKSVQGGYAPGFDAASRALRRDAARGSVDASLGAELEIKDRVNSGRQWGIGGMSGAEGNLQGLRTSNMLRGLEGAGGMEMNMQNSINQYRLAGYSQAQAAAMAANDLKLASIRGQEGLYNTDVGRYEGELDRGNALMGQNWDAQLGLGSQRNQLALQPGAGSQIAAGIGGIAGGLAGVYSGSIKKANPLNV